LDLISNDGYEFISLEDLNGSIKVKNMNALPKKACLITFDDGLKESYENGLDILDKKGVPVAFFIIGETITEKKVLPVHKFHYIRNKVNDEDVIDMVNKLIELKEFETDEGVLKEQYPYDSLLGAKLKYLFNFIIPEEKRKDVIDQIFNKIYSKGEKEYSKELYMDEGQIKELAKRNSLGTHSLNHKSLASLTRDELREDIQSAMSAIFELTGNKVETISYPYGGYSAVNEQTANICKELGLISGLTMYRGINRIEDIVSNSLLLKRLDMNDMLGGKSENIYKELISAN